MVLSPYLNRLYTFLKIELFKHLSVSFHRNTYLLTANLLVTFVSGVTFWMFATRLMTPKEVGTANAFLAPTTFLAMALLFGVNYGLLRFSNEVFQDLRLLFAILWITLGVSTFVSVICALFIFKMGIVSPINGSIVLSTIIYAAVVSGNIIWTICEAIFIGLGNPLQLLVRNIGFGLIRILILIPFARMGELGLAFSFAAGFGVAAFLSIDLIRRYTKPTWSVFFSFWHFGLKKIICFSLPNHVANLLSSIPGMVLPLVVFKILGADINGYFSVAWMVTMIARSILTASSATLLAEGSRDASLVGRNLVKSLVFLYAVMIMAIIPMVFLPQVVMIPFGHLYATSNEIALPILAISILPSILTTVFVASERIKNRSKYVLLLSLANGILSSVLSFIGARYYAYLGFTLAYLMSQIILGLLVVPSLISSFKKIN